MNEAPFQKAFKDFECAVFQHMPVAGVACDGVDFTAFQTFVMDEPAEREFMQNTLFVL
ncbi:hypothetical protein NBRC116597_36680 [Phaeobacter sp. NW0010-22]